MKWNNLSGRCFVQILIFVHKLILVQDCWLSISAMRNDRLDSGGSLRELGEMGKESKIFLEKLLHLLNRHH